MLQFCKELFDKSTLRYSSGGLSWQVTTLDYKFKYDAVPFVKMENHDLIGIRKVDSITIKNTSGIYYPLDFKWKGEKGEVDWTRAGLTDKVYCIFGEYEMNTKANNYQVDKVTFYHPTFFDKPIEGKDDLESELKNFIENVMGGTSMSMMSVMDKSESRISVENAVLTIESQLSINANIRALGEQIHENETALKKGTHLTPAAIAFLASLGITEVEVFTKPSIVIVVTGNELVTPGNKLEYGQIYESNAIMLQSALKQSGYHDISVFKVNDDYNNTVNMLDKAISNHDLVLVSGGISVGDYDFVGKALNELDVEQLFYKVKQKPGKPLFFGKKDRKIIFALPGNPAAVLSCFYIYALPTLNALSGNTWQSLSRTKVKSKSNYIKKGDRAQFLKAIYNDGLVEILDGQNSSMVHTFSLANALVYINENDGSVKIDDFVDAILLPIH